MIVNGYWRPKELFEHLQFVDDKGQLTGDAAIGIVISNRTGGKTVNMCIKLLQLYEERGLKSIICCRYLTDKRGSKGARPYFPDWVDKTLSVDDNDGYIEGFKSRHEIKPTPEGLYVDGELIMYCEALTESIKIKDTRHYDHVAVILMDEAIQEGERYLVLAGTSAMTHIFRIWQTAARGWEDAVDRCNIVFLSNVDEYDNWIFNDLKLNEFIKKDTKRTSQNGVYFEKFINESVKAQLMSSTMGKLMQRSEAGSRYFLGSVLNEYTDNDAFVKSRGLDFSKIKFQVIVDGKCIGIFAFDDILHCAKIKPDSRSDIWTNSVEDHKEGVYYENTGEIELMLASAYSSGKMTFQTQEVKNIVLHFAGLA